MRLLRRVAISATLCSCLAGASSPLAATQSPRPDRVAMARDASRVHAPEMFGGLWDYNAEESVNAATGRPEQSPRSATQPGAGQRVGGGATRVPLPRGMGPSAGWSEPTSGGGRGYGPPPQLLRENRDLSRDLLEVPEALTIRVMNDQVTFIDDLNRERTYPTDGSRHKYQLAASRFNARLVWDEGQLRKEIDGGFGFKMTETYFLSQDGQRLFVIVRVAKSRPDGPIVGADRVYDRVIVE